MFTATSLRSIPFAAARAAQSQVAAARTISSTATRYNKNPEVSPSTTATRHGNDPETLEKGKQQAQREPGDKGQWHEEVASDAEAFVKSIRQETHGSKETIKELQEETAKTLKEKK